jgi:uncharacterized membrane-anchored protein
MLKGLTDHPQRYALTNELHARPFQPVAVPGRAVHLALKRSENAASRDPREDRAHLIDFLDRHGAPHPPPEANQYVHDFGRFRMKWERHTEFNAFTLDLAEIFPREWLEAAGGEVIAAIQVEVLPADSAEDARKMVEGPLSREFTAESLAVARVLDDAALAMGDFRIHEGGFSRFALVVYGEAGPRRIGRLVQRLIEIEVYRAVSMLALPVARDISQRLNDISRSMAALIDRVARGEEAGPEREILSELTELSADLESMAANTAFRFGARGAYEALVHSRIDSLREERVAGRQLFSEFMARRYDPAMRTCQAAERRLAALATRASRIGDLLSTRVNVAVEAQNQRLLESMDRRAALQLRLQETVEGLSVVAISYYAVSLATYILAPIALRTQISEETLTAAVAIPVIGLVWWMIRRMRERLTRE